MPNLESVMSKRKITVISLAAALGIIILLSNLVVYLLEPKEHTSPFDFPNTVWECDYNGATTTLLVGGDGLMSGYIDKDGERTYIHIAGDSIAQAMLFQEIPEEEFYGDVGVLSSTQTILNASFRCTDTVCTLKNTLPDSREAAFWGTEEPIELVFYRVSG